MKIVCISDTHNLCSSPDIPQCDVLIHAGDATMEGTEAEGLHFMNWFQALPGDHKIFVPGNHDSLFESGPNIYGGLPNVSILIDRGVEIDGINFWGSPWQSDLSGWAFHKPRKDIIERWDAIPEETDILITHVPPRGSGDRVNNGDMRRVGSKSLRQRVSQLPNLKHHIFGHIHEGYGTYDEGRSINAALCDDRYQGDANPPIILEL